MPVATVNKVPDPRAIISERWRSVRRVAAFLFMLVVAALLLRLGWGYCANRELELEISDAHARGEAILPEDLNPTEQIPDSANAAMTYLNAAAAVKLKPAERDWEANLALNGFSAADLQMMRQIVAHSTNVKAILRGARDQPGFDWGVRMMHPTPATRLPHLNPARKLGGFLGWSARAEHEEGNDAEAMESVRDLLHLTAGLHSQPRFLVTQLVALGIDRLATDALYDIAPELRISRTSDPTSKDSALLADRRQVNRRQVDRLIDILLDERALRDAGAAALICEGVSRLDCSRDFNATAPAMFWAPTPPKPVVWMLTPLFIDDGLHGARVSRSRAEAFQSPNYPAAQLIDGNPKRLLSDGGSALDIASRFVNEFLAPASSRVLTQEFRTITDRRVAAVMLALRCYQLDHDKALPRTLEALTPNYLPTLPADPMRSDGGSFGYLPELDPPILYSVGENGTDDKTAWLPPQNGSTLSLQPIATPSTRWRAADVIYFYGKSTGAKKEE